MSYLLSNTSSEFVELQKAVEELQHYYHCHHPAIDYVIPIRYPIHPPAEPKEDKKFYCICGAELEIIEESKNWGWYCKCKDDKKLVLHISCPNFIKTKKALLAELEKLPKGEK